MDSIFLLIKDSIFAEAEILKYSNSHHELLDVLEEIINKENILIENKNNLKRTVMESKHPHYSMKHIKFEIATDLKEKEIAKYSNGQIIYKIEEI